MTMVMTMVMALMMTIVDVGEGDVESHRGCREACKTRLGEDNGACVGILISICICGQY